MIKRLFYVFAVFYLTVVTNCGTGAQDPSSSLHTSETLVDSDLTFAGAHSTTPRATVDTNNYRADCPDNVECKKLSGSCLNCTLDYNCIYGLEYEASCKAKASVICTGQQVFTKKYKCQYCYQSERWQQTCSNSTDCKVVTAPLEKYLANCTVSDDIICLGRRKFHRHLPCNWTSGKRWTTALILSITLGGFGADRFYLGHWRAGIGKLFSFGGLGVWTIVDVILVASGYVGPADYSLYIS